MKKLSNYINFCLDLDSYYEGNCKLANKNFDKCISFYINDGAFLGRFVRFDNVINTILEKHSYPLPVSGALAESCTLGGLLSGLLKYEGLFTLQTKSSGPIDMVVVDVTSDGKMRACANFNAEHLKKAQTLRKTEGEIEETPNLLGNGYLAFTVDQGNKEQMYQGIVDLQGKTLSDCAMRYFKMSEQIETYLQLYVKAPDNNNSQWQTAGIILQKVANEGGKDIFATEEEQAEAWNEALIFAKSLQIDEIFNNDITIEDILHRLYHNNKLVISAEKNYIFGCRCSREKLLHTIQSFSKEEINSMVKNNKITAECHFCSEKYVFEKGEVLSH